MRAAHLADLFGVLFVIWVGCPGGESANDTVGDDDATGDDDTTPPVEIGSTDPADGATDVYYRTDIRIVFTGVADDIWITLVDGGGSVVDGVITTEERATDGADYTVAAFDPFGDADEPQLSPETDYTVTIEWADHAPVGVSFRTGMVGTPLDGPAAQVEGRDVRLDLASATFTEPPGMGSLYAEFFGEVNLILRVEELDAAAGTIRAVLGCAETTDEGLVQDLCQPTMEVPSGTWLNPYLQLGPMDISLVSGYYDNVPLLHATIGASFEPVDAMLQGGTLDGFQLIHDLGMHPHEGNAACALLESLGIECVECPDGSGIDCIVLAARAMPGQDVQVSGANPETGEQYDTLIEVTPEMVEAWEAGGFCP